MVVWSGASDLYIHGSTGARMVNLAGATFEVRNDQQFNRWTGGALPPFHNAGTFRKTGGAGTTTFYYVAFENTGTVEAFSGTLAFNHGYTMTGGEMTFGFASDTDFGKVTVSGSAGLAGALGARLLGGYLPAVDLTFPVMSFGSSAGGFTDTNGLNVIRERHFEPAWTPTALTLTSRFTSNQLCALRLAMLPNGRLHLSADGSATAPLPLECSTNLVDWVPVADLPFAAGLELENDLLIRQKFFRVRPHLSSTEASAGTR